MDLVHSTQVTHTVTYSPFTLVLDTVDKSTQIRINPQGLIRVQREIPVTSSFVHYIDTMHPKTEVHVPLTTVTILMTMANLSPITGGD